MAVFLLSGFIIKEVLLYLKSLVEEILVEKNVLVNLKASDLIKDKLAQWACKAAVKAGDSTVQVQVAWRTTAPYKKVGDKVYAQYHCYGGHYYWAEIR